MCAAAEGWRGWWCLEAKGEEQRLKLKDMGFLLRVERDGKWRSEGVLGSGIEILVKGWQNCKFERPVESLQWIPFMSAPLSLSLST